MAKPARLLPLALLLAAAGCGGADRSEQAATGRQAAPRRDTGAVQVVSAPGRQIRTNGGPTLRLSASPGLRLSANERDAAVRGAQRFGVSLARWLYGDRDRLAVEPISRALRRELQSTPPYIPADQRGTGEGRVEALELALQNARSGVVTVIVNDLRTSYRIPAALELRGGRWLIVDLHNH